MKYATEEAFVAANAFGKGAANTAYAQYFVGNSYLNPLTDPQVTALHEGMVITIPPEVKHWHGAKGDSWFSHIAMEVPGENASNEWCEPVSDADYNALEAEK